MKRSSLFGHIIELHELVRKSQRPADGVVREFVRARHYLGSKDRRFITDTLFDLLRHFKLIQAYSDEASRSLGKSSSSLPTPSIVLLCTYCARIQDEPVNSLLPDLAGLWRVYVSDVNCEQFLATIQSIALPEVIEGDSVQRIATRLSFPEFIIQEWLDRLGNDETEKLCATLNTSAPITIRVNTLATSVEQCQNQLRAEGIESQRTSLSPVGLMLSKRINVQSHASFKTGLFEMQDEGSQIISMLVGAAPGMTVVDACAGGGGKSLHLAAMMCNQGSILAFDVDQRRLDSISERLQRSGVSIVKTLLATDQENQSEELDAEADAVLIDAPCTSVGTFRRNPWLKSMFTRSAVEAVTLKQRAILSGYSSFVKRGGRLVYATCSLLKQENEDQIDAFLHRHPSFELLSAHELLKAQGVDVGMSSQFLTLLPHKTNTDGFFSAVMVRR